MSILKETIKCPLCVDSDMVLLSELRDYSYRGSTVQAVTLYYECGLCREQFTTTESDTVSLDNIHKAYHDLHS